MISLYGVSLKDYLLVGENGANVIVVEVIKSSRPVTHKLLWCVVVFLFPILGLIFYWLFSNRTAHMGSGDYEAIP